jgi:hypothetical protein
MLIESTVFAGIIAIFVSMIGGLMSYANLIIGKDQKTSEFRQAWIDAIREDVSKFSGLVTSVSTITNYYKDQIDKGVTDAIEEQIRDKYFSSVSVRYQEIGELSYRIRLRLNPKGDAELIEKLISIEALFVDATENMAEIPVVDKVVEDFIGPFQNMLGEEWARVKLGEPSFYISKYIFIALILAGGLAITGSVLSWWDLEALITSIEIRFTK